MATSFQAVTLGSSGPLDGFYFWSTTANWTNGVPVDGEPVTVDVLGSLAVDNIADLSIPSLNLEGAVYVLGTLTIGALISNDGSSDGIDSESELDNIPSTVTIDTLVGSGTAIGAYGADAITAVLGSIDPGEVYSVGYGGEVELAATPNASSSFIYDSAVGGTFAFSAPASVVSSSLYLVAVDDSIALPGSSVTSVIYDETNPDTGAGTLSITTNLGTTTFTNVTYAAGAAPNSYSVSTDPSGLERITFTEAPSTSFQAVTLGSSGPLDGFYFWSTTANWTNGVPVDGEPVTVDVLGSLAVDNIADLSIPSLNLEGAVQVLGTLTIGALISNDGSSDGIDTESELDNIPSTVTIDTLVGSGTAIGAYGADAITAVLGSIDPGEVYSVGYGGEVELAATPNASS